MTPTRRWLLKTAVSTLAATSGCSTVRQEDRTRGTKRTGTASPSIQAMPTTGPYGFTHLRANGNRVLDGTGALPTSPVRHQLGFEPAWLIGLADGDATVWIVVGVGGSMTGIRFDHGTLETFDPAPAPISGGAPPVIAHGEGSPRILVSPTDEAAQLTHPFPLGDGRALLIGRNGDVLLWDEGIVDRHPADALPDARIVNVESETYAVLGGATTRYDHGALGDSIEASTLLVLETDGGLTERTRVSFDDTVVEGVQPIGARLADSNEPRLLVTETDTKNGARIAAYDLDGERVATGPGIGTGFRWRHQLCVAPFGPDASREIAVVKTPHIGGIVEFYRRHGDRFEILAERSGYSTHAFGSRNLDGALAADLDGDGSCELLAPTQARDRLSAIRRTAGGTEEPWQLSLPDRLTTNIGGVVTADDRVVIGAGTADGTVQFWA